MREKNIMRFKDSLITVFIILNILFLNSILITNSAVAQNEELIIQITNEDEEEISQVYERDFLIVSVYYLDSFGNPKFLNEVDIEFNQEDYTIDEDSDKVYIQAPTVTQEETYQITARKSGYVDDTITITVKNQKELTVVPEKYTVDPGETFAVTIRDEDGNPVSGATIAIQNYGASKQTDDDGIEWLTAPGKDEGREKITIIAQKEGYEQGKSTVAIYTPPAIPPLLSDNLLYIVAFAVLVITIIFVNRMNKKKNKPQPKDFSNEQVLKKYNVHGAIISQKNEKQEEKEEDKENNKAKQGPKVEEIRISRPKKEKEVVPIYTEKKEERKAMPVQSTRKKEDDWFEGKDDIRSEIDKLTGKAEDEDNPDKWFEGIDDIRAKIDEKVKKKDKEKEEEEK